MRNTCLRSHDSFDAVRYGMCMRVNASGDGRTGKRSPRACLLLAEAPEAPVMSGYITQS